MELQYKFTNALIDRITGFDINQKIDQANKFDYLSRTEIEKYQNEKFGKLMKVAKRSRFYSNWNPSDYSGFPVMDRENFMQNFKDLIINEKHPYKIVCSSGSTNTPVRHYITREMLLAKRVSHQKMLRWYGLNRESPEFKIGGLPIDRKTRMYYYLKNKLYFSSFDISALNLPDIIRKYNQFKPKILLGYPSTVQHFLNFARMKGFNLHYPEIVVTHAENLYADIISTIRQSFSDIKLVNQYWSTEANIAETCPHGSLHIDEDTVICELINKDANGTGDLLVTNLFSYSVPYIRYKIGDRVKFSEKPCTCGRQTRVIESFEGREIDVIELKNGKKFPVTAFYFGKTQNVLSYQLIYKKREEKLVFKYVLLNKNTDLDKKYIFELIREKMGLTAEFEQVHEIKLTQGGKFKRLITEN